MSLELRGSFAGKLTVSHDEAGKQEIGAKDLSVSSEAWETWNVEIMPEEGCQALYLHFVGDGNLDCKTLSYASK